MNLTRLRFGGVPPFDKQVEFKLDQRVNVFVGPNASGKSRLLSEIDDYFNEKTVHHRRPFTPERMDLWFCLAEEADYFDDWTKGRNVLCADADFTEAYLFHRGNGPPPIIYVGPIRVGLPSISELKATADYGSTAEEVLAGPFSGDRLNAAIDLLYKKTQEMYELEQQEQPPSDERRAWNFLYVDDVAYACAKSICGDLLATARALNYPTGLDVEYLADQPMADLENIAINRMLGVATNDVPKFEHIRPEERPINLGDVGSPRIYVGDLSSGSQSTLLWIVWLAFKMLNHYDFAEGWARKPCILLIDEVENHLHPTWQRRVIPALLEHFPGLQIFATTHSPFVVAGLKAGQVHMLKRDANGVVTASTNDHDIIGWTTDEILRTFMGVDEPTDQLTIDRRERLLELRRKDTLTDEEAAEMEELRRQVNEDFLSSSTPLEAQRERYGDMMLEFLRSRQSELSQDGS